MVDEEYLLEKIQTYYPQVNPLYIPCHQQVIEYLALHYDLAFTSMGYYQRDLSPLIKMLFGKHFQFWYCPHGNSDKTLEHFREQDMALIYGDQMEKRLKQERLFDHLRGCVRTGHYRFMFYQQHAPFYDEKVKQDVFSRFAHQQTTLLYAPTWEDFKGSSSLFHASLPLLEQLPSYYNLIIKPHPWLEHYHPGYLHWLKEKYRNRSNLIFLDDYPLVLPLLKHISIYIGDFSSIGYDFLYHRKPMFFFDSQAGGKSGLYQCGHLIPQSEMKHLFSFVERHLDDQLEEKKEALFHHVFDPNISLDKIREEVIEQGMKLLHPQRHIKES